MAFSSVQAPLSKYLPGPDGPALMLIKYEEKNSPAWS